MTSAAGRTCGALTLCALGGCAGVQSALAPAGVEAADIATLMMWLFVGGAIIWAGVLGLAVFAVRAARSNASAVPWTGEESDATKRHETRYARRLIIGGGVVFPVVTLCVLLVYGLRMTPPLLAADSDFVIDVTGEQWWWRLSYERPGAENVVSANEIRLPVDRRVTFRLAAADVIHSFWIPVLGGKIDMIPGRTNQLTVEPTATGRYRGVCAEFCGLAHAMMAFDVVVMQEAEFDAWLQAQAADAAPPAGAMAVRGQRLFLDNGCGACHRIGGTPARGAVGPDLTHVGSRLSIAAGTLPLDESRLAEWISQPLSFKPGVEMPSYHMLAGEDVAAIAAYLRGLE